MDNNTLRLIIAAERYIEANQPFGFKLRDIETVPAQRAALRAETGQGLLDAIDAVRATFLNEAI